jgi:hypothetical protein
MSDCLHEVKLIFCICIRYPISLLVGIFITFIERHGSLLLLASIFAVK